MTVGATIFYQGHHWEVTSLTKTQFVMTARSGDKRIIKVTHEMCKEMFPASVKEPDAA